MIDLDAAERLGQRVDTGWMEYDLDDDPARIQPDVVWGWLSTEAYWGRQRSRADVEAQIAGAWRLVGAYRSDTGEQVGFARAVFLRFRHRDIIVI